MQRRPPTGARPARGTFLFSYAVAGPARRTWPFEPQSQRQPPYVPRSEIGARPPPPFGTVPPSKFTTKRGREWTPWSIPDAQSAPRARWGECLQFKPPQVFARSEACTTSRAGEALATQAVANDECDKQNETHAGTPSDRGGDGSQKRKHGSSVPVLEPTMPPPCGGVLRSRRRCGLSVGHDASLPAASVSHDCRVLRRLRRPSRGIPPRH